MNRKLTVLYCAAHAEFPDTEPLGGGKAVADFLIREWEQTRPFELRVLSPKNRRFSEALLHQMSELQYTRFCREFERATTAEILKHDPKSSVVLCNDISEGPDFVRLKDYRIVSIWHVDVVEYFTKFYLRGLVRPETAARWSRHGWLPDVLKLVFQKQHDCVKHSRRIVVPSTPMKATILRCYPWCAAEKIVVLPWGNVASPHPDPLPADGARESESESLLPLGEGQDEGVGVRGVRVDDFVIITLSRLSPEKGIERLLQALPLVRGKCRVLICGAAAYMSGRRYEKNLRRLANGCIEFLGHVTGEQKAAILQRADLFVSPSRHESYGLTIAEAEAAGCRIISHAHYGARGRVVNCEDRQALAAVLDEEIAKGRTVKTETKPKKSDAAERLAKLIAQVAVEG